MPSFFSFILSFISRILSWSGFPVFLEKLLPQPQCVMMASLETIHFPLTQVIFRFLKNSWS